jgi:hypothetical protein
MTWDKADAILTELEREMARHAQDYPTEPPPIVVLPRDISRVVRLDAVIDAMRFYRRQAT